MYKLLFYILSRVWAMAGLCTEKWTNRQSVWGQQLSSSAVSHTVSSVKAELKKD